MATIEVPEFWTFCTAEGKIYGSIRADQRHLWDGPLIATPEQAWAEFYDGERAEGKHDKKQGCYVRAHAEDDFEKMKEEL